MLHGVTSSRHPIKLTLDPEAGRWLASGSEDGRMYIFDLDLPQSQPVMFYGRPFESDESEQAVNGSNGGAPAACILYCVAWNPKLQMMAVCARCPLGKLTILQHDTQLAASQPNR